ncbi:MAG TPA: hypothetical protein VLU25_10585 [Acidobacteriota bacterium]|nr:hypothetical protein [Acidobacteriota bacterium]
MKNWKLCLVLAAVAVLAGACASVSADAKEYKVEIGESASMAKVAEEHDVTEEALKEGRSEYSVKAADGMSYKFMLSEKQIKDLMDGSTVVVDTAEGGMKVKIGPKKSKPKKSGW